MAMDAKTANERLKPFRRPKNRIWRDSEAILEKHLKIKFEPTRTFSSRDNTGDIGFAYQKLNFVSRKFFLDAVGGQLKSELIKALDMAPSLPYQQSYSRLPFRGPNSKSIVAKNQGRIVSNCLRTLSEYNQKIEFFAEWCGYTDPYGFHTRVDIFLAAAIDNGNREVLNILIDSVLGKHPVGIPCRSNIRALLLANSSDGWQAIENLLLQAKREEGLRQVIFESIDELNPKSFVRFVRLVIEHDLLRFSSVFRAFSIWLPNVWQEKDIKSGIRILGRLVDFIENSNLASDPDDPVDVYLKLWAFAYSDIELAIQHATIPALHSNPAVRRSTLRLLRSLGYSDTFPILLRSVSDSDLTVSSIAINAFHVFDATLLHSQRISSALWDAAHRWPKEVPEGCLNRHEVFDSALRATPNNLSHIWADHIGEFDADGRRHIAIRLRYIEDTNVRTSMALKLFSDVSGSVRDAAITSLQEVTLALNEMEQVELQLKRKSADLRKATLELILKQGESSAFACGCRLLESKDKLQRDGGLEILAALAKKKHMPSAEVLKNRKETQETPKEMKASLSEPEYLDENLSIENGFGLYTLDEITFASKPKAKRSSSDKAAAIACIEALEQLFEVHKNESIFCKVFPNFEYGEEVEILIGNLTSSNLGIPYEKVPYSRDRDRFPLASLVENWASSRLELTLENGGQDLIDANLLFNEEYYSRDRLEGTRRMQQHFQSEMKHLAAIGGSLPWILKYLLPRMSVESILEQASAQIGYEANDKYMLSSLSLMEVSWRTEPRTKFLLGLVQNLAELAPERFAPTDWERAFHLFRYVDEPRGRPGREKADETWDFKRKSSHGYGKPEVIHSEPMRMQIPIAILSNAIAHKGCTEFDVMDQVRLSMRYPTQMSTLATVSKEFRKAVEKLVNRMVEIEVRRGELATGASSLMTETCSGIYLGQVCKILEANVHMARVAGYYSNLSKAQTLTRLLEYSRPLTTETPEICAEAFKSAKIKEARLVELAMLSPHWAKAVELAIGWKSFTDAVWWLHAHTKEDGWGVPDDIKEIRLGEISERSRLTSDQFVSGSCDVDWFHSFIDDLTPKRWVTLEKNAKFAAYGNGHARAQLFAKAIQGRITVDELLESINSKRNPNAVRALGLVPLGNNPEAEVRRRYDALQEFKMSSRKFGSMRQSSEKTAISVALENLARNAGYPDPLRLVWSLEASEVEDLADGKTVFDGEVAVTLQFSDLGDPEILVRKGSKELKEIPSAIKKNLEVKELVERRTRLRKQAQRMRLSLEEAMQRGDLFRIDELMALMKHPGLRPMLRNLVFVGSSGASGFLEEDGRLNGEDQSACIAHPYDLLRLGNWPTWQHRIFAEERIQPFKQAFRELYLLTEQEKGASISTRYGGHQVKPYQSIGILGKRGWAVRAELGVSKTLHGTGLVARLLFDETFYTPADVEGLTIRGLAFTKADSYIHIPLSEIPPIMFSETMRDLDLIVSVASMVGLDPESSESSIEMRTSLVRETASLLRLANVSFLERHVLVKGKLAEYTVHLGSGVVHQQARGELVIVAVRQPQRGRLFLPFVDDDPRSAEIVSKVILLARDDEIKDPTILSQIVRI